MRKITTLSQNAFIAAHPTIPLLAGGASSTITDVGATAGITVLNGLALNAFDKNVPVSGGTITITRWETVLLLDPVGTLTSLNIVLPPMERLVEY